MGTSGASERTIGLTGVLLVLGAAALVLISFRFLDWYDVPAHGADSAGDVTFGKLHTSADQLDGAGVATAYFDWLAWVLLIVLVLAGVTANLVTVVTDLLRVVAFVVGVVGVAATYYALAQHFDATGSHHNVFHNSTWGLWLAFAGFLVGAAGGALGPRATR